MYQEALEEEDKEDDFPSPLLPTRQYDPINAFLSDNAEELTLTPEADPSVSKNSQLVPTVSAPSMFTSPPKFAVSTSLTSQSVQSHTLQQLVQARNLKTLSILVHTLVLALEHRLL